LRLGEITPSTIKNKIRIASHLPSLLYIIENIQNNSLTIS